ncbi:inositol-1-monophosphatase [Geobacter sp. OR-1]|uniref:inositol monophosphatase family protein n=1 Tax=Geobacter sp. OR-1 TaxID=1266765 RepID=UPI0005442C45|nr:inositol monophosphatase family protein [Geobacter sp. OR-1]GAM08117.1 inositol-1-monophosphatase [Geobacter sp. OR-1]
MNEYLMVAEQAARAAGKLQLKRLGGDFKVSHKGAIDLVTEVDRESESLIVKMLRAAFPGSDILAEENDYGARRGNAAWIVDPLDGTTNFAHRLPWFCVSIGLEIDGEISVAALYHPCMDEMFTAIRGEGAFLNGNRLAVSAITELKSSILASGFPYDRTWDNENNLELYARFTMATQGVRRFGAAALDLAYVAAGRLDGFWECKLKPWDVAAGKLLVQEAGGRVTNYSGDAYSVYDHRIVASNRLVHDEMLEIISSRPGKRR